MKGFPIQIFNMIQIPNLHDRRHGNELYDTENNLFLSKKLHSFYQGVVRVSGHLAHGKIYLSWDAAIFLIGTWFDGLTMTAF